MTITNADYDKIVAALQAYIDGFNDHDVDKFKKAFHEDAWMFYVEPDGTLRTMPLSEKLFRGWASPDNKHDPIQLRVVSVAQMGDAAGVALGFGEHWLDFHSLVRQGDDWKSTNKTASHSSLARAPLTTAEYDKIVHTLRLYVDGFNDHDVDKFKEAFHEDAWMFFVDPHGELHTQPLDEAYFKSWLAGPENWDRTELRVISVARMGDAAQVAIAFGDDRLEFHSLVRVGGQWKITSKTASHRSR